MKCTWAEETEVYIGLDYPLKESHWEGYKKIEQYLNSLKKTHLFKTLHVVIRSTNLGIGPMVILKIFVILRLKIMTN